MHLWAAIWLCELAPVQSQSLARYLSAFFAALSSSVIHPLSAQQGLLDQESSSVCKDSKKCCRDLLPASHHIMAARGLTLWEGARRGEQHVLVSGHAAWQIEQLHECRTGADKGCRCGTDLIRCGASPSGKSAGPLCRGAWPGTSFATAMCAQFAGVSLDILGQQDPSPDYATAHSHDGKAPGWILMRCASWEPIGPAQGAR